MSENLRWIIAFILMIALLVVIGWIAWDAINCISTGGTYVEGLPWYTCVGG